MIETEYKSLIDENTYKKIDSAYKWDWKKEQINAYYFDESLELSKRRIMVRIREKDGEYKMQVKFHKNADSPLHICEEKEFDIDGAPDFISAEEASKIIGIKTGKLMKIGTLTTMRNSLMWNETTEICLDKSIYLGNTDYEIEVEFTNGMPEKLKNELSILGVEFKENAVGKYTRFIRRFKDMMSDN